LPTTETIRERQLREKISALELNSATLQPGTGQDDSAKEKLVAAREELTAHIKKLEENYPGYYKYKYADSVLSLSQFQNFLNTNRQGFLHYFIGDSVSYALAINGNETRMIRVENEEYSRNQIDQLASYFADKGFQNSKYPEFVKASYKFYSKLFAPLNMSAKNLIICADGFALPFDALSEDENEGHFLVKKFGFSYVYSAASLLSKPPALKASGDFLGFAPVSFKPYLSLASLTPSAASLDEAAENYSHHSLFVNDRATRQNLLSNIGNYSIVNIFSHASAGTDDSEPVLFMQDSVIHLSELQYLPTQAARLVILSACQTSSGKNQLGEGIYSLSRGFAAAGIPTVMATIWKADEQAVYKISVAFNRYISQGMRQDEALQKAKLDYLEGSTKEQSLPYYWSNIVLMGTADPIVLDNTSGMPAWGWGLVILSGAAALIVVLRARRSKN
ncbi:MAG: CHAT domain-containing protein, partial [Chitinophagaceae bacterium]